ncbi:carboxylesterase [Caballeronia calidae]|uniref:Carboxylic ester hydrolase n=1 Tax=Caballeronia calidae TaxID=1777139 RepID=A0A158E4J1_9BURK|nr:carboxylesterase family protein [Caballeronia calidae]SAL01769.1 carboxylesterase [Caballeronia calidae]
MRNKRPGNLAASRAPARMARLFVAVGLCVQLTTGPVAWAQTTPVVDVDSGPVRGINDAKMKSFLGIPYAAPPVGDLRWRPPQAPKPWSKPPEASKVTNECPQNGDLGVFASAGGNEDCLYLNVYVPRSTGDRRSLPVFVWIHGGNLTVGRGADYDPRKLVADGNVIVVTINYRLGVLGFFSHPKIDGEGHPFANYGQMDQTFALDWVQRNIRKFGGDPDNVTIAGESSGGTSVLAQIISPWAAGKFQHAIIMSGGAEIIRHPYFGATRPVDYARKIGSGFANASGCSDQSAACLRGLSVAQILAHQKDYIVNQTIIDGDFMPMQPSDALRDGKFNHVTIVNGTTSNEGTFFAALPENSTGKAMTEEGYSAGLGAFFGDKSELVAREYPIADYQSPSEAYAAVATDYLFSCPALMIDKWASEKTTVHAYEFNDRTAPSYIPPTTYPLGAAHTFELSYIFSGFHGGKLGYAVKLNSFQKKLSDEMVHFWTSASNTAQWADWPRFEGAQPSLMQFMLPENHRLPVTEFAKRHHCDFWDSIGIY